MGSRRVRSCALAAVGMVAAALCAVVPGTASGAAPANSTTSSPDWPEWTHDVTGTRFAAGEKKITPSNVHNLNVKWAFAYPNVPGKNGRSQPAVVGGVAYFGSPDGKFYAVSAQTGATIWSFDLNTVSPGVGDTAVWDGPTVANGKVIFGDHRAFVYALSQSSGALLWATRLDTHPFAALTGSPTYYNGKVYIGVSSLENGQGQDYACCTFRGQIAALDATTGAVAWRFYTVPPATAVGTWPNGVTMYAPSGGAVWGTPIVDPGSGTVYIGTGQNYTGVGPNHNESAGDIDSLLALNASTGAVRWKKQFTNPDVFRLLCTSNPDPGYCPGLLNGAALDWDVSPAPNLFTIGRRTVVGIGAKSGVYHVLDAATGATVWEKTLGHPAPDGDAGIQWGTSYDGRRLYIATWQADPGTLFALDPSTGNVIWSRPNPSDGCTTGGVVGLQGCQLALTPAVTTSPGVVYEGSWDGKMRAFSADTGAVLWTYDTVRYFDGVNGLRGHGSAISGNGGAVVSNGIVFVQSGYYPYSFDTGYVLLAFSL
jgi:polyvinyl alcohol dehydrogenase (cytochrome)